MLRQLLARNVHLNIIKSPLIRRTALPIVRRSYSSTNRNFNVEGGPNRKVAFLLAATAAIGAIYYVNPKKQQPKKIKQEIEESIQNIEPTPTPVFVEEAINNDNTEANILEHQLTEQNVDSVKKGDKDLPEAIVDELNTIKKENEQLGELEEETKRESAYNPETGEINWDCPCLGGMAHGPCGEEFKEAFSCFIYSEAEPKGIDCVEKFQGMQTCFRKYPEYYAEQLKDENDEANSLEPDEFKQSNDEDSINVTKATKELSPPDDLFEEIELTESD